MILVAAGLIRKDDHTVIVQHAGPEDLESYWTVLGGVVKDREFVVDTLAREILEETDLDISGPIRHVARIQLDQTDRTQEAAEATSAQVLEVSDWSGLLNPVDPDNHILRTRLCPVDEARRRDVPV